MLFLVSGSTGRHETMNSVLYVYKHISSLRYYFKNYFKNRAHKLAQAEMHLYPVFYAYKDKLGHMKLYTESHLD